MKKCLICQSVIEPFMSFGKMPIANGFLSSSQFVNEYFFEMEVASCPICHMFQLINRPEREMMFNENYAFFSGTSKLMEIHFEKFANHIIEDFIHNVDPFIVEIGSNDGIMLQNFAKRGIKHLGIEPSENVANIAKKKGINTVIEFFDKSLAEKIVNSYGKADVFMGANVMCHIPYIKSIIEGIKTLVKPSGIAIFEDPYLGDVILNTTYDQIYDEHTFLFSVTSIAYLFDLFNMEVIDVEPQETHGGSMRYIIAHKGEKTISENVSNYLLKEKEMGLHLPKTYDFFKSNCEQSKHNLLKILDEIKSRGQSIVGYAATSKSTTIINYCGITTRQIDYICDTTPIKQGKFSPGAHIPIKRYEEFKSNYPEFALLFGYNHYKEIMSKEAEFIAQGGKWVTYVPEVKVIS